MYKKELSIIRKRRVIFWLVFFGYIPFMIFSSNLIEYFYSAQIVEKFIPYIFFIFAFVWILVTVNSATSICPKCGERYCHHSNIFCQRCHSCGLELRSDIENKLRRKYLYLMPLIPVLLIVLLLIFSSRL